MKCQPTPEGFSLCIKNSARLFKDACSDDISLPTTGALFEIGLEESAKGSLLLILLLTEGDSLGDSLEKVMDIRIKDPEKLLKDFMNEIYDSNFTKFFQEDKIEHVLEDIFRNHKIKVEFVKMMGYLLNFASYNAMKNPDNWITEEEYRENESILMDGINVISEKIKEEGFYVTCTPEGLLPPYLDRDIVVKIGKTLLQFLTGLFILGRMLSPSLFIDFNETELVTSFKTLSGKLKI